MNNPYNLTWPQARALALGGARIRRFAWEQWLTKNTHLWWITQNSAARVVQAADFGGGEFIATDWTTADWAGVDVCSLAPPGIPPFTPPPVSATAALSGSNLVITALLGAATYGSYWLTFFVNGGAVYATGAVQSGAVAATIPAPVTITSISVRVQSVLPLPAWQVTVGVPVPASVPAPVNFYTCGLSEWYGDSELTASGTYSFDGSSMPGAWSPVWQPAGSSIIASGGYFAPVTGGSFYRMGIIARDFTMTFKVNFSGTGGTGYYRNNVIPVYASKPSDDGTVCALLVNLSQADHDLSDALNCFLYNCDAGGDPVAGSIVIADSRVEPDQPVNTDIVCRFSRSGDTMNIVLGDQTFSATLATGTGGGDLRLGFWFDTTVPDQIPMVKDIVVTIP